MSLGGVGKLLGKAGESGGGKALLELSAVVVLGPVGRGCGVAFGSPRGAIGVRVLTEPTRPDPNRNGVGLLVGDSRERVVSPWMVSFDVSTG